MTPSVFKEWLNNINKTKEILGSKNKTILKLETQTLNSLQRGVYAKRDILKNEILDNSNIYFAFPLQKKQISTIKLKSNSRTKIFLKKNEPILERNILRDIKIINEYVYV
jgi:sialic acid synthase SpsE